MSIFYVLWFFVAALKALSKKQYRRKTEENILFPNNDPFMIFESVTHTILFCRKEKGLYLLELFERVIPPELVWGSFWVNKSRDIVFFKKIDLKSVWVRA